MTSKLRTSEWFLIIILILSPLYFHGNLGSTGLVIPNNIIIWFTTSIFIAWSVFQLAKSDTLTLPKSYLYLLVFPITAWFISVFAGVELFHQWLFRMLFVWGGILFFFALFQHKYKQGHWDRLLFFILFAGFCHSLIGLGQIIFVKDIPSWLPINPSGVPTGFFQQINNQASFQVTVLIIAIWLNTRPYMMTSKKWRFYFSLIVIGLSSFIIAYSGSRVGTLGLILAVPLILFSRWKWVKLHWNRWLIISLVFISSVITATLYEQDRGLMSVAEKTAALNAGYSASARLGIYSIAWEAIQEKPLYGHGIGSFVRVWQNKKPAFYEKYPDASLPNQRVSHPHNELMFWLVEGGILVGLALFVLLLSVLINLIKLSKSRRYAYIALLIPISLHTQVELPFYISSLHWFLFLTILAMTLAPTTKVVGLNMSQAARSTLRVITLVLFVSTSLFFVHSYIASLEIKHFISHKENNKDDLSFALSNPYFKPRATDLLMFSMFKTSMKNGISSNIKLFAEWAEETIPYNPHPNFFKVAINANLFLKQSEKVCNYAQNATAMYPDNRYFKQVHEKCIKAKP